MNTTFHMILIPSHVVNLENVILGRISLWPMPWAPERRQGRFFQRLLQVNPFLSSKFPGCVQKYIVYHISYGPGIYIYIYICRCKLPWAIWELVWLKQPGVSPHVSNVLCFEEKGWEPRFSKSDMGIQTCDIHIQFFSCVWGDAGSLPKPVHQQFMQVNHYANRRKFPQHKQTNDLRVMAAKIQGPVLHWSPPN